MTKNVKKYTALAKEFVALVEHSGIPVEAAYIFGSRVKGREYRGSDLDTCVVSRKFGKDRIKERVRLMLLSERISDLIEPHPYSLQDFADRFDPLAAEIKRTGIKIA